MEFIELNRLMNFAGQFWKAWDNYNEKLITYEVWQDNYEEEEFYEEQLLQHESDLEESVDELIESFLQLSRKVCVQNVAIVPSKEKKVFKEIINILSKNLLESSKEIKIIDLMKSSKKIFPDNIFRIEEVINFAKFKLLLDLPYFNPDAWLKEYTKINPLVLSLDSRLPREIEERLNEATFCYIYGFYNASTAICRSVLEGLLKKNLRKEIPNVERRTLKELLSWLEKKSTDEREVAWNVNKVSRQANKILHNLHAKISKSKSKTILLNTRKLLEELL
ncbi:MAG: hypothetical protein BMS9Abin23_0885 [Thermodesulfobacteriota bacterium]|nr:MAG: hypothetical protein BMS9Abin23_0885 [Thermodesulfobacteriota bacterium]